MVASLGPLPETDMSPARGWLGKWVSCSTGGYIVNWRAYIQKLWLLDRCYLAQLVDETSTLWLTRLGPAQSVSIEKALEERECESKWSLYTQATELEMVMKKVQVHLQWYSMHCLSIFYNVTQFTNSPLTLFYALDYVVGFRSIGFEKPSNEKAYLIVRAIGLFWDNISHMRWCDFYHRGSLWHQ